MEARKITIVSTKNQKKSVIMSSAETLGELKADLVANNIDYSGMTFYEGTAKVELKADESALPKDVNYKGTTTNELVFMLTNTDKKIRSGASEYTRGDAYAAIKKYNLEDKVLEVCGRNFTQCKTADLVAIINAHNTTPGCTCSTVEAALDALVESLHAEEVLSHDAYVEVKSILGTKVAETNKSSYSDSEIEKMFEDIC